MWEKQKRLKPVSFGTECLEIGEGLTRVVPVVPWEQPPQKAFQVPLSLQTDNFQTHEEFFYPSSWGFFPTLASFFFAPALRLPPAGPSSYCHSQLVPLSRLAYLTPHPPGTIVPATFELSGSRWLDPLSYIIPVPASTTHAFSPHRCGGEKETRREDTLMQVTRESFLPHTWRRNGDGELHFLSYKWLWLIIQ